MSRFKIGAEFELNGDEFVITNVTKSIVEYIHKDNRKIDKHEQLAFAYNSFNWKNIKTHDRI